MLRRIDELSKPKALELLNLNPVYNLRIISLLNAYGTEHNFFNVYMSDKSIIAELEGNFFIAVTEQVELEEIEAFIKCSPKVSSVSSKKQTLEKLFDIKTLKLYSLMSFESKSFQNSLETYQPKLQEVYDLLKDNTNDSITLGDYMPWYADMSHRIRHGSAEVYGLLINGQLVTALLLTAITKNFALIGGVVTDKSCRKKGYAKKLLNNVSNKLLAQQKVPILECNDDLIEFYKNNGFKKIGDYAIINL